MALRLKTLHYWFQNLDAINDLTDTNFTQITVFVPETTSRTFRSVTLDVQAHNRNTTISNTNRRQISVQVGAAGYSVVNNTNAVTQSGEQYCIQMTGDFTSYFQTNFAGASMTCDARVLLDDATATPLVPSYNNATAKLVITYEYDDAGATQIKTTHVPLDAPAAALGTAKPGTATAVIPALDTFCAEASKTFRQRTIVMQGNSNSNATTDYSLSNEIGTLGVKTGGIFEGGGTSAIWFRNAWTENAFATNVTQNWFVWASLAIFHHMQAFLVVTYEFNASTSTTILQSLLLPMEIDGTAGGVAAGDVQRTTRGLWIPEPGTITIQNAAAFLFYESSGIISGINARAYRDGVTPPAYRTYTDNAGVVCGGSGLMFLIPTPATNMALARGKNTLVFDVYNTDAIDRMFNLSVMWMINYHSGKATAGVGAHNHSVRWGLSTHGTGAAVVEVLVAAAAPIIPETEYFLTSIGAHFQYYGNSTGQYGGIHVGCEFTPTGTGWAQVYEALGGSDPEIGTRQAFATARSVFRRWPSDTAQADRLDLETARRWRTSLGGGGTQGWHHLDLMITYHSISAVQTRAITGSDGGTVNIDIHRVAEDEVIASTSRVGNGNYTFTWFDDTAQLYAHATEGTVKEGRSKDFTASL